MVSFSLTRQRGLAKDEISRGRLGEDVMKVDTKTFPKPASDAGIEK